MMEKNLNSTQPMQGWRERFDEKFCVKSNPPRWIFGTHLKKDLNDKDIIDFISQQKSLSYFQGRADMAGEIKGKIEKEDFFLWNEETQRMIKDKTLLAIDQTINNKE